MPDELWRLGTATVRELHRKLGAPNGLAYTTTAKVVDPLREKRLIRRRRKGRAFWYQARIVRAAVERAGTRHIFAHLLCSAPRGAIAALGGWRLPTAFLPHWDEGIFVVPHRTPPGTGLRETLRVERDLMRIALRNPNVERASLVVGRRFGNSYATPNKGVITILLKPHCREGVRQVMRRLRHRFRLQPPDLTTLETMQVMIDRLGNLSGSHAPGVTGLFGGSAIVLHAAGERLLGALLAIQDFHSGIFKDSSARPDLHVTPNALAALLGLSPRTRYTGDGSRYCGTPSSGRAARSNPQWRKRGARASVAHRLSAGPYAVRRSRRGTAAPRR